MADLLVVEEVLLDEEDSPIVITGATGDRNVEQNGERVPQGVCVLGSVLDLI